ncbi:MAG: M67 family metallopeptidase [Chloroflexi bacterium]|nr:M67 family metallopeptidase [Chloroflexota bacterium]
MPEATLIEVQRSVYDEMIAHALEDRPYEVCGLLAGQGREIQRSFRATNRERSPVRYEIEPADLLRIFREIDDADLDHLGIYHSHTHTRAYPSATDIRLATYPDALYFIVSLMDERNPYVKAFHIRDGEVSEIPIQVIP